MTIFEALSKMLLDVDAISKARDNRQQGYKFRGIDDVYNAIHPLFARFGVFSVPTVLDSKTEERQTKSGGALIYRVLTVRYTFYSGDGSHVEAVVIGEGMDSGDKASNKAMAVAHKYAICQILSIPTDDAKDPENDSPDPAPKKEPPKQQPAPKPEKPSDRAAMLKNLFAAARPQLGERYNEIMARMEKDVIGKDRKQWNEAELEQAYKEIEIALNEKESKK